MTTRRDVFLDNTEDTDDKLNRIVLVMKSNNGEVTNVKSSRVGKFVPPLVKLAASIILLYLDVELIVLVSAASNRPFDSTSPRQMKTHNSKSAALSLRI